MRLAWLIAAALLVAPVATVRAEDDAEAEEVFGVLADPRENKDNPLDEAVGTFDRALGKYQAGELSAIRSNLGYNRQRLEELRQQEAAQKQYLDTFWERVAVYFEDLKHRYGNDETNPSYRKAAISLKEEYEQREAGARRELERIQQEIARVAQRISELSNREQMAQLAQDLRGNDLAGKGTQTKKKPVPSRADQAIEKMTSLTERKYQRRVARLAESAPSRKAWDACFAELAETIRKGM